MRHEHDSYLVQVIPSDKVVGLQGISTCNVFKAIAFFIYLNFKHRKLTVEFRHNRYY